MYNFVYKYTRGREGTDSGTPFPDCATAHHQLGPVIKVLRVCKAGYPVEKREK